MPNKSLNISIAVWEGGNMILTEKSQVRNSQSLRISKGILCTDVLASA